MQVWSYASSSVSQTMAIAAAVARHAVCGDVIALSGELGTGKTQFVRGMAIALGVNSDEVSSPTFVMVHEYSDRDDRTVLVHIDAYRLKTLEDLVSIGWDDADSELRRTIVVIEWADRLAEHLGANVLEVRLMHEYEQRRLLTLCPVGTWVQRMAKLVRTLDEVVKEGRCERTLASSADATAFGAPPCPICGQAVDERSRAAPFCSDRCRMVDLNRWFCGDYTISRPIEQLDLDEGE